MNGMKITVCLLTDEFRRATVGIGKSQPIALDDATYQYAALADVSPDVVARRLKSRVIVTKYFERTLK